MRILYIDCDSLRPDHLHCYGYERETSPTIDRIANDGLRFTNVYTSDAPCLPSRTAFYTGRFGFHTGVINHGGMNADPRPYGSVRTNNYPNKFKTLATALKQAGLYTTMISPFPARHDGWQVVEGFRELYDTGRSGHETADEVYPIAESWLKEHASRSDWFLHVNYWDPHTAYRTPVEYGNPFDGEPIPDWLSEDMIAEHYAGSGAHSAQDLRGWGGKWEHPRMPGDIASLDDYRQFIDGYDVGIHYMDQYIGKMLDILDEEGVLDETYIIISADHGENLGELNVYGDHQTADKSTCNVPLIVSGPDIAAGIDTEFHYQLDLAPTLIELCDAEPPAGWDGQSFISTLTSGVADGRESLVLSQGTWTCQRGVRWDDWLLLKTYHDAFKSDLEDIMLFNVDEDPYETNNLAEMEPEIVNEGLARLQTWIDSRLRDGAYATNGGNPANNRGITDPMWEVLRENGPYYTWDRLADYLTLLRETGREDKADILEARHS